MNKNRIILGVIIIAIIFALALVIVSDKKGNNPLITQSPSPSESPIPTPTPTPNITETPKPTILLEEKRNYQSWFNQLDSENQVLGVYSECQSIVPSNVEYKNNTTIMLDNTRSGKNHLLKIGSKEYAMTSGQWYIVSLSSSTLPVDMAIYCEGVELGSVRLVK